MRFTRFIGLLVLCWAIRIPTAQAQEAAPPTPVLVPPALDQFVPAQAPANAATLDATVELVLSIGADGRVTEALVDVPAGHGFDEAAVAAAKQLLFKPASADGVAIPSRIRFRYEFQAIPPPAPPTQGELVASVRERSNDAPIAGVQVTLTAADGSTLSTVSDASGAFSFSQLAPGSYSLVLSAPGHASFDAVEQVVAGERVEGVYRLTPADVAESEDFGAVARVAAPEREIVRRSIRPEELARMAGTRGDPLRTIELLPGVARPPGLNGMLLVRGSAPGDSEVFLDGVPIYNLYHFGGLTSVVNGFLLDGIDLYPGNFSVRYGRKTGGIIDTNFRDPKSDRFHGLLDINVVDAWLLVEMPLGKDVALAVAGRRSYLDAWIGRLIEGSGVEFMAAPVYYDYQALLSWRASAKDKVRLVGYGSYDELMLLRSEASDGDPELRGRVGSVNSFNLVQLEWQHDYAPEIQSSMTVSAGPLRLRQSMGPQLTYQARGFYAVGRAEWNVRAHHNLRLNAGLDMHAVRFDLEYHGPLALQSEGDPAYTGPLAGRTFTIVDRVQTYLRPAAYAELVITLFEALDLTPGVRVDYFHEIEAVTVDPRLNARLTLGATTLRAGAGLFSQPPNYVETISGYGNPKLEPLRALHLGAGVEQRVSEHATVSVDGFYKRLSDLVVNVQDGVGLENRGEGRIYGVELMGRVNPGGALSGFVSYTLSRSERNDLNGTGYRLFDYDQTHVLNCSGSLKLGNDWLFGTTFRLASGNPETPVIGASYDANVDLYRPVYGSTNSRRNSMFHRLDLRLEKTWRRPAASVTAYLDVQNVYNRLNREGSQYNFDYSRRKDIPGLPIIPSIGLRAEL